MRGRVLEAVRAWPNQTEVTVRGVKLLQEDSPDEIGTAVAKFIGRLRELDGSVNGDDFCWVREDLGPCGLSERRFANPVGIAARRKSVLWLPFCRLRSGARADRNRRPRRSVGSSFGPSLELAWRQSHGTRQFTDGVQLRRKCHALSPPSDLVRSDLDALGKRTGSGMGWSLRSRGTTLLGGQKGRRVCGLLLSVPLAMQVGFLHP